MSLSGWRPADVVGWSSRKREPAFGPRLTTSNAEPTGSPSTPDTAVSGARLRGSVQFIEEVGAEDGCRLHGDFIRGLVVVLVRHPLLLTGRCCVVWLGRLDRLPTRCDRRCDDRTAHRSPMCRPPPDRRRTSDRRPSPARSGMHCRRAQGTITRVIRPACRGRSRRPAAPRIPSPEPRRRPEGQSASRRRKGRS